MRRRELSGLLLAATGAASLLPRDEVHAQTLPAYPQTPAEAAARVTPSNASHPPGVPERYGAIGNGIADDTAAFRRMIISNVGMTFTPGKTYGITTITFPIGRHFVVNFNGAKIRGIAASPTTSIVRIETEGSTFIAYDVDMNFNTHYTCGTWWYNASASSQYNSIFGMKHSYGVRGLIYGELPGRISTRYAQSENSIYGWRTRGVQNPFFGNHSNGVIFFSEPMFVSLDEEWPSRPEFNWPAARAFENYRGMAHIDGGEIQMSAGRRSTYAADVSDCQFQGSIVETNVPLRVVGDSVRFTGGRALCLVDNKPQFYVEKGLSGQLALSNMRLQRPHGVGSYSSQPLVNATAASSTFEIILNGCESYEWRWSEMAGDARLVRGGLPRYIAHRLSITATDPHVYVLDTSPGRYSSASPRDRYGYSLAGWYGHRHAASRLDFRSVSGPGPAGSLSTHFSLSCAGPAAATNLDETNLASIRRTAVYVRPGDLFLVETWIAAASGNDVSLAARFYDSAGNFLKTITIANRGAIRPSWHLVQALLAVPAGAAYMGAGVFTNRSTAHWTDFRVMPAS